MQALRDQDFYKSPGVAETIDWATALTELDARSLTPQLVGDTLGALLKYQDDIARMQGDTLQKVLKEATSDSWATAVRSLSRLRGRAGWGLSPVTQRRILRWRKQRIQVGQCICRGARTALPQAGEGAHRHVR